MSGVDPATDEEDEQTPLEEIVAGIVTTLTLAVAFGLLALGYPFFWVAFVVGFAGVLPTALGIVRYYQRERDAAGDGATQPDAARDADAAPASETEDALETLRERYARGDLTEAEFEARLETLLQTEAVEDARDFAAGERGDGHRGDRGAEGSGRGAEGGGRGAEGDGEWEPEPEFELE